MQLINFDQQQILTSEPANEQWKQTLDFEVAQDEIILLREQIDSLQQYLFEQLGQQQAIEQELYKTNQELERMNTENQLLVEEKCLFVEEIKEFIRTLPNDGEISRRALLKLLSKFYNEINFKELEPVRSALSAKR